MRFSPIDRLLAVSSCDGTVELWSIETGVIAREIVVCKSGSAFPFSFPISFSPDGNILAVGLEDTETSIGLWDVQSGTMVGSLDGHTGLVTSVEFGPEGRLLASGSQVDKTIRIWDVDNGQELWSWGGDYPVGGSLGLSPDGTLMVYGLYAARTGTTVVWDLSDLRIAHARRFHKASQSQEEALSAGLRRTALASHEAIFIDGDGGFTRENGVVGGSGTSTDPYRIEGWEILATHPEYRCGIYIRNTDSYITIRNCIVDDPTGENHGIGLWNVENCAIEACVIQGTQDETPEGSSWTVSVGISILSAANVTIEGNRIEGFGGGILISEAYRSWYPHDLSICENQISALSWAIGLFNCSRSTIQGNSIQAYRQLGYEWSGDGIYLAESRECVVADNVITDCTEGIVISGSSSNTVTRNEVSGNTLGINVCHRPTGGGFDSESNVVFANMFRDNEKNACCGGTCSRRGECSSYPSPKANSWDSGEIGNYWDDYEGKDKDGDGIGDTPYVIAEGNNVDRYPLMTPGGEPNVQELTDSDLVTSIEDISILMDTRGRTTLHATVHNLGAANATGIVVQFFDGNPDSGGKQLGHDCLIDSIPSHGTGIAELQFPSGLELTDLYVVVDPENEIPESNEENNIAFAHVVSSDAFSEYDSFYKYTHLEGDDPVIIGALVGEIIDEKLRLIENAVVEFKIEVDGREITGTQVTDARGCVYFDLSTLAQGTYSVQLRAYSEEEHLISSTITKSFRVIETDLDVRGYITPKTGVERECDLYDDGRPDYYVKIGGKVEAKLHVATDVPLKNAKLLFNPLDYYRGSAYQRTLGNIPPGGSRTFSLDFEVRNGERYAAVAENDNDYDFLAMYVSKVTPIVYLFFDDPDGNPHRAMRQLEYGPNTYSRVFPYSPSGPSSNAVTLSSGQLRTIETLALEHGSTAFHKATTIRMLTFDQMVRMGNAITLFKLAHKGLFLGLAIDQTIKDLEAPPSTARQIRGVRNTVALSVGLIGVANLAINVASLPLATVPPLYLLAASATSAGLSLLADHVERQELERQEAYAKDMAELPLDLVGDSLKTSLLTVREETESGSVLQKTNSLRVEFFNTLSHERTLNYQLQTLDDSGHVLDNIVDEMTIPAADQRNLAVSQRGWKHGTYILRYYVEESDESREITGTLMNAVGIRDILFTDDSGVQRAVFLPGETVNITLNYMNGRESPVEVVSNVSIRTPNGETISIEDDRFTLDPPRDSFDDGLQPTTIKWKLSSDAEPGRYTVVFSLWDPATTEIYDQSDFYEFTVYYGQAHSLTVQATCPVDLFLLDPKKRKITKHTNEIPGATYEEVDINGDGEADDRIYVPNRLVGNYYVKVVAQPDARPMDTYTLEVSATGETVVLAKNEQIRDIPERQYVIKSAATGISLATESVMPAHPRGIEWGS